MLLRLTVLVVIVSAVGGLSPLAESKHCQRCMAQAIFDEEPATESEGSEENTEARRTPPKSPTTTDDNTESSQTKKKKKKKARKKRKSAEPEVASPAAPVPSPVVEYSPQELAKQSYAWAPEGELQLKSRAPGLRSIAAPATTRPPQSTVVEEERPRAQGFKLPQIPLTQVLIVGAFVVLFLLYRLQVGRQIKRRRY